MAIVVQFIKDFAPWVYGACALIALWYLRVAILARRERRYAMFTLEREAAMNRIYGAWTAAIILLVVMGLVYFTSTIVSQAVQPLVTEVQTPTPEPVIRPLITPTLPLPEITPTNTPTPRPRPTRRPQPTVAPVTPSPVIQAPRCPDARAVITAPGINAVVSGMVPVLGTAVHEQFQRYELYYGAGADPATWSYFDGREQQVQGGQLGTLNAGVLGPGTYSIRLRVVDITANYKECQTVVVVK
jgi:hypothetical protein